MNSVNYSVAKEETLVRVWAKIITRGTIEFLRYEDGNYQLYKYSYWLDTKNHTYSCGLIEKKLYKSNDNIDVYWMTDNWKTSSMFNQINNYDPYFRYFSDDFLEISNDDKIRVLDSISSNGLQK